MERMVTRICLFAEKIEQLIILGVALVLVYPAIWIDERVFQRDKKDDNSHI